MAGCDFMTDTFTVQHSANQLLDAEINPDPSLERKRDPETGLKEKAPEAEGSPQHQGVLLDSKFACADVNREAHQPHTPQPRRHISSPVFEPAALEKTAARPEAKPELKAGSDLPPPSPSSPAGYPLTVLDRVMRWLEKGLQRLVQRLLGRLDAKRRHKLARPQKLVVEKEVIPALGQNRKKRIKGPYQEFEGERIKFE